MQKTNQDLKSCSVTNDTGGGNVGGAFLTAREIFEHPIWQNIVEFRLFLYLCGKACFQDGVRIGNIVLKRGQWVRSYRNLQDDLSYIENRAVKKYSISVIQRAVQSLVKQNRITIESAELGTLFTVTNYDKYQCLGNYKNELGTALEQRWNGDGTELEQGWNNNNNAIIMQKNAKNAKDNSADKPPKVLSELEKAVADFEEMRKKIRKPLTPRAKEIMLKKLKELAKDEKTQIAILEQSIMNSWQGVFPLKDEQQRNAEHPYRRVDHNGNIFLQEDV